MQADKEIKEKCSVAASMHIVRNAWAATKILELSLQEKGKKISLN